MRSGDPLKSKILEAFSAVFEAQNEGASAPGLLDDSILLDTGLDSLGFAILVSQLEDELGYDPFTLSRDAYYPQTFGDFVEFYRVNAPK